MPLVESAPSPHWLIALALTALAYAMVGVVALQLSLPPDFASPLFPSAGIALAAVLTYGRRMLPGVWLGSLGVNLVMRGSQISFDLASLAIPVVIAVGASLQALTGAWLVRRFVPQPLTLGEPRDIASFFGLGAALACVVSASLATLALGWGGLAAPGASHQTWLTWWSGDTLGVLIGAPIALTVIGRPRSEWVPRRLNVGLTLSLVTAVVAAGIMQVARWDKERMQGALERDAENAVSAFEGRLQEPLHAVEALRGIFVANDQVTPERMRMASRAWLDSGTLAATGWSERIRHGDIADFEARVRAQGMPDFRVFDRSDAGQAETPAQDADAVVIRYIEPMQRNAAALGVNALSIPVARQAIDTAARTGLPSATAGFRLTQQEADQDRTGVVVYAALYDGDPQATAQRVSAFRGVVFVTLRLDELLNNVAVQVPRHLQLCIVDTDPKASRRRLAGHTGCEAKGFKGLMVRTVTFAGREWELRVQSHAPSARTGGANAWLFSLVGLMAAAMLGALLLTVTGRTRRIEEAVQARTAALQAEVRDRERAQAALRESQQRLRNILNNVPIGIIYTDLQGRAMQANPSFCQLSGYSEEVLRGVSTKRYTHPDDQAEDAQLARRLLAGELPMYRRQKRLVTQDGSTLWVQSTVTLLRDAAGDPQFFVGAVEDITERLRLQEAESARETAEASSRAKSEFLSRMSHELRTPMNAILGFAQLLELDQRHPLESAQKPWVQQIQQSGWHLLEMINDVLDLSRIESGNLRLRSENINLCELIGDTVPMIKNDALRRRITITTALGSEHCTVRGDPTRARQIIINLLSNAVKYNVDGGSIDVSAKVLERSRRVEISITDSGIGMSAEQLADLYTPFNRLGREGGADEGTGIGLVISKSLAELMGGTLQARSQSGRGTTFVLSMPQGEHADIAPPIEPATLAPPQLAYPARRVHYIEDNETNIEVMRGILAQRPQVRLSISMNGADGLAAIRADRPDLILLDMHLPDMSGREVLRELKAVREKQGIPVVAVSADALPEQIQAALAAGAQHYLTKPVGIAALLEIIDLHLGSDAPQDATESAPMALR